MKIRFKLDHVSISKSFKNEKYGVSVVNEIYVFYHDAVKVQIKYKQNNQENIDFYIRN